MANSPSSGTLDTAQMLEEAARLHRGGQPDLAERLRRGILGAAPDHIEARYRLGVLRAAQGRVGEAMQFVTATLKAAPDHLPALSAQALLLAQSGRFEEALAPLDRALALAPDAVELYTHHR